MLIDLTMDLLLQDFLASTAKHNPAHADGGSTSSNADGNSGGEGAANRSDDQSEAGTLPTPSSASPSTEPKLRRLKSARSSSRLGDSEGFTNGNSKKSPSGNSFQTTVARLIKVHILCKYLYYIDQLVVIVLQIFCIS